MMNGSSAFLTPRAWTPRRLLLAGIVIFLLIVIRASYLPEPAQRFETLATKRQQENAQQNPPRVPEGADAAPNPGTIVRGEPVFLPERPKPSSGPEVATVEALVGPSLPNLPPEAKPSQRQGTSPPPKNAEAAPPNKYPVGKNKGHVDEPNLNRAEKPLPGPPDTKSEGRTFQNVLDDETRSASAPVVDDDEMKAQYHHKQEIVNQKKKKEPKVIPKHHHDALSYDRLTELCQNLPGADDVVIIIKTGATEVHQRLSEQILTLANCVPNFVVFSDLEQDLGEVFIYDALDEISHSYRNSHEDFELYHSLQRYHTMHQDLTGLGAGDKGWNLDKWKNIPMQHKAYAMYPDMKWYVTMDADTYISWFNLLHLLNKLDHTEPLYFGSIYVHYDSDTPFAQGGTGYVLSQEAARRFEEAYTPANVSMWERETAKICCGDVMLSKAMLTAGIEVKSAAPMFQSRTPATIDWDYCWCDSAITWHHVRPHEVEALWHFEQEWITRHDTPAGRDQPYQFKHAYEEFVDPHLRWQRSDWDNQCSNMTFRDPSQQLGFWENHWWDWLSDDDKWYMWNNLTDWQKNASTSAEKCKNYCMSTNDCLQWRYRPGSCNLNQRLHLGHITDTTDGITSGWLMDRVEWLKKWKEDRGCEVDYEIKPKWW